jgi:D-alanyl-lipoteichoic acid acyltransferase DltB (MBOAT superfamily)
MTVTNNSIAPEARAATGTSAPALSGNFEQPPTNALSAYQPLQFLIVLAQLALLGLIIHEYRIETQAFRWVFALSCAGLTVHHFLPLRLRMAFFAGLSLTAIIVIMGWFNGLWLIGCGCALIGMAHVPASFAWRTTMVALTAIGLAALRAKALPAEFIPNAIWPVLGSMFMFRMIVYLYDMHHRAAPLSAVHAIAYFFMLPNVCFPLYPIVDYKTFCRSHFEGDAISMYQTGVRWIFRGVVQLILYRVVYHLIQVDPATITEAGQLFRFMLATYLLYLKVSGEFHVIIGMLRLFGFNLPETHHLYLISTSFTDFWRRINIYWKDFIMKIFFYPMYFRLKSLGHVRAMVLATLTAFFATWVLHMYQWFWLRGSWMMTVQDTFFWAMLALLVVINAYLEFRHARKRTVRQKRESVGAALGRGTRAIGTFLVMCVLWSVWSADSVEGWFTVISQTRHISPAGAVFIAGILGLVGGSAMYMGRLTRDAGPGAAAQGLTESSFWRQTASVLVGGVIILLLTRGRIQAIFGPEAKAAIVSITRDSLNARDRAMLTRGYYEDLTDVIRFNSELFEMYMEKPADWKRIDETEAVIVTDDVRSYELRPDVNFTFLRVPFSTNRWGMRDRDYPLQKPPGVLRIAVTGASISMGWGIADGQDYCSLLEELLSQGRPDGPRIEVLNFSCAGYGPVSRLATLESKVSAFDPDIVFYISTPVDMALAAEEIERAVRSGRRIEYDFVLTALAGADCSIQTPRALFRQRLNQFLPALITTVRQRIADFCNTRKLRLFEVRLPMTHEREETPEIAALNAMLGENGFIPLDLSGAYRDVAARETLDLAAWDDHPNSQAQKLIADELLRVLKRAPEFAILLQPQAAPE